jgi:hypothetical protein
MPTTIPFDKGMIDAATLVCQPQPGYYSMIDGGQIATENIVDEFAGQEITSCEPLAGWGFDYAIVCVDVQGDERTYFVDVAECGHIDEPGVQ